MDTILGWRRELTDGTLRTPYPLNLEMQMEWFEKEICDRKSNTRYIGIYIEKGECAKADNPCKYDNDTLIGYGGIEHISWENGTAEISLLIAPWARGLGRGKEAVDKILDMAFIQYRMNTIFGECFLCSQAVGFWKKIVEEKKAFSVELPGRKYFNGKLYGSYYFSFSK